MRKKQNFKYPQYLLALSASFAALILYLPAIHGDFVWDDVQYVLENPHIRLIDAAFFKWSLGSFYAGNWHPLTWLSHAIDLLIWGFDPAGHHVMNILLHAANTFLVVLLVFRLLAAAGQRMVDAEKPQFLTKRVKLIAAGFTGLLFGLHPLHVESAAWIAERKDLLCSLFYLLSIMMYVKAAWRVEQGVKAKAAWRMAHGAEGKKSLASTPRTVHHAAFADRYYLAALGFFILALLSKPMAVSLPVILLVLDWHPFSRITSMKTFRTAFVEKLPFIAFSLVSSILTILAQDAGGAVRTFEMIPFSTRLVVAAASLIGYLRNMIAPFGLLPYYPYPGRVSLYSAEYVLAVILVIGITVVCISVKKRKYLLAAWFCYVVMLVPVLGLVQVGGQSMADRYTYLPSIAPFLLIGLGASWLIEAVGRRRGTSRFAMYSGIVVAAVLFLFLSNLTRQQISIWKDNFTLWSYVIDREPERVPFAYYNRGLFLDKIGRTDLAIEDYRKALLLNPSSFDACNNLGILYGKAGRLESAIEYFSRSIGVNPRNAEAYGNRGSAYALLGLYSKAEDDFSRAIALSNDNPTLYLNRGLVYLKTGNRQLALADFQKGCALGSSDGCERYRQNRALKQ